ncbi:cysteine desulfurase [bacterium]|nr:cysteine desulfurase [bacterium]
MSIRSEFPILNQTIHGMPVTYLDSASTSLKPRCVLEAIRKYYEEATANVHRSTHLFGETATQGYEDARNRAAHFLNARPDEIVFVRNTTEAVNLVALSLRLEKDDEILITPLEHHSNQLPWASKVKVVYVPLRPDGLPDSSRLEDLVTPRTKLMGLGLLSNVTGTRGDVEVWREVASKRGIPFLLDASQAGGHMPMDVQKLGCDFLAFSGHKVCGPSGIGVLWGKRSWLEQMAPPFLGGGMVHESRLDGYTVKEVPWCFEAGTPNVEGAMGLAAALEFLEKIGMKNVEDHSKELGRQMYDGLKGNRQLRLVADQTSERYGIVSFFVDIPGLSAEAFGRIMADTYGILLSAGKHCTHPYHDLIGFSATVRASTHVYTTEDEVNRFLDAVREITG